MMTQEKDSVQETFIIGENQYKKLFSEVIEFKRKNIHNVIKKNNLAIFKKKNPMSLCRSQKKWLNKIVSYMPPKFLFETDLQLLRDWLLGDWLWLLIYMNGFWAPLILILLGCSQIVRKNVFIKRFFGK